MRRVYPSRLSRRFESRFSHAPLRTAPIRPGHNNDIGDAKNDIAACRRLQTYPPLYHPRRRATDTLTSPVPPPAGDPAESATPLTSSDFPRAPNTVGEAALGYRSPGGSVPVAQTLHVPLLHSILVSFLDHNQAPPARQHPTIDIADAGAARKNSLRVANNSGELDEPASRNDAVSRSFSHADHPIVALCPFEGGEGYVRDAVYRVADEVNANVVRIDLPLALGFEGPSAPLQALGVAAPPIPRSINPLLTESNEVSEPLEASESNEGFTNDDEVGGGGALEGLGVIRLPLMVSGSLGLLPDNPASFHGYSASADEWISFFVTIINRHRDVTKEAQSATRPKIILLEGSASMAETFDVWWPSFIEAVQRCRAGPSTNMSRSSTETASRPHNGPYPVSIVLSVTPSLLATHTRPLINGKSEDPNAHSQAENSKSAVEAIAERLNSTLFQQAHSGPRPPAGDPTRLGLWSGSLERDARGRSRRSIQRIERIMYDQPSNWTGILPFPLSAHHGYPSGSSNFSPVFSAIPSLTRGLSPNESRPDTGRISALAVGSVVHVMPTLRDLRKEASSRRLYRRMISAALISQALHQAGGRLTDPERSLQEPMEGKSHHRGSAADPWGYEPIVWSDAKKVARSALGRALASSNGHSHSSPVPICWADVLSSAAALQAGLGELHNESSKHLQAMYRHNKAHRSSSDGPQEGQSLSTANSAEAVKNAKNLNNYERRLLGCIVDTKKLNATGFDKVHLPSKTIDAIRTIVSLPLLFPGAFRHGLLRKHSMGGALLFGPPGTGKTLLARAVASESGAQMLAIQPSDVNNMYVGESEKIVKAIFSLARRLSPCVIFLDEVDAIFGGRSARDASASSKAHTQVLTEFMQEMDGLSSAISNNDHRIVVVGATNRPFDLDDAILRRLPRRLLIDLPDERDREAILRILLAEEKLHPEINLRELANITDGYSGSDLKHLCVSAALAALKENVAIPWLRTSKQATLVPQLSESLSSDETLESCVSIEGETHHDSAQTSTVAASEAARPYQSSLISVEGIGSNSIHAGKGPSGDQHGIFSPAYATKESLEQGPSHPVASQDEKGDAAALASPHQGLSAAAHIERVLTMTHFKRALEEVSPSANELGTLPELRKWAQQFGEGGSHRGKKSGFGKGFGFSRDKTSTNRGYGRVLQND